MKQGIFAQSLSDVMCAIESAIENDGKPFYLGRSHFKLAEGWVATIDTPKGFWKFAKRFCVPTKVSFGLLHPRAVRQRREMAREIGFRVKYVTFSAVADEMIGKGLFSFGPIPIIFLGMEITDLEKEREKALHQGKYDLAEAIRRAILLGTEFKDDMLSGACALRVAMSDL